MEYVQKHENKNVLELTSKRIMGFQATDCHADRQHFHVASRRLRITYFLIIETGQFENTRYLKENDARTEI